MHTGKISCIVPLYQSQRRLRRHLHHRCDPRGLRQSLEAKRGSRGDRSGHGQRGTVIEIYNNIGKRDAYIRIN